VRGEGQARDGHQRYEGHSSTCEPVAVLVIVAVLVVMVVVVVRLCWRHWEREGRETGSRWSSKI
jgi:hypothetical protein